MSQPDTTAGFTVVELVIALFVVGLVIATGWQAYALVTDDSKSAREHADASNIAYEAMRRATNQASSPCTTKTLTGLTIPSTSSLPQPSSISGSIACLSSNTAISLVTVTVTYGANGKVSHAIYTQ